MNNYYIEYNKAEQIVDKFVQLEDVKTSNLSTLLIVMCLLSSSIMKEFEHINSTTDLKLTFKDYLDLLTEFNNKLNS